MNTPFLTWALIIGIVTMVIVVDLVYGLRHRSKGHRLHHHLIEAGSEREMFFIPGDRNLYNKKYDEFDEFDDF